ncbi:FecR family protein [Pedobacter nyackensis]|uniref:FecR family protein n=1 Tax=Pedobacter nyackensis TaxID=475255 RepID=A0A1W2ABJ5_9SPHI|nr:FecR family protein [Pedobacter nyackensis]SMC57953.1 FecR family protein [Pedobacter nyackensis]
MDQEEKLNWDKLLKHIEGNYENDQDAEELNEEELELLLLAEETNMRLKEENPEHKFPVAAGWDELQARYKEKEQLKVVKLNRSKLYRTMAIAAILALVLAPAWWLFLKQNDAVKSSSKGSDEIHLTLANGETVELEASQANVLKSEGATLNGSTLIYQKETSLPKEEGAELQMNVLEVPNGKYTKLELSDGTLVWVNSGSKLSYPTVFSAAKREVMLEGEAYFDVSHNAARPFVVHLKSLNVKVLGTAFSISTFGNVIHTALERGKVSLETGNQSIYLLPGELGKYNKQEKQLSKTESDLRAYTAWKDSDIYFDNSTLEEIASRLQREYNLAFSFENDALKNLHFTIDMPKTQDVSKILNNIKFSSNQVNFMVDGNKVQVKQR